MLGAAKTGSGKTLAFVVPLLESLFRGRWSSSDGLGALIISPTRELALQIFEVLKSVGWAHYSLSAGVVCGGKSFEEEQEAIGRMSILVATPGRLLQHLEQSPEFDVSGLRVLVLDEADRLLDLGFSDTLNSILSYLPPPPQRQTMLFSATQTKSVKDLARLSLKAPEYVAVHEAAVSATPSRLAQTYVVVKLQDKLNLLYSFVRSHLTSKTIVFVSSCKQARFLFESFRRLRPGVPLQLLHGKMKQQRRMLVYYDFVKKPACVLFATDVAARGLDFPSVDWVMQLDCPEEVDTYIHRVGRTARFKAKGHALLALLPSEAVAMVPALTAARIPLTEIHVNPEAAVSVTGKLAAEVAADPELKHLAQRAFCSYIRSVYLQPNRAVFGRVTDLPTAEYAESLGLATVPDIKVLHAAAAAAGAGVEGAAADTVQQLRAESHKLKNSNKALARLKESIAASKEAKRRAAAAAAATTSPASVAATALSSSKAPVSSSLAAGERSIDSDDDGSDDDDDDSDGGGDDAAAATTTTGLNERSSSGFLLRRVHQPPGGDSAAAALEDAAGAASIAAVSSLPSFQQAKIRRIEAAASVAALPGGARVGSDGLTPFQRVAAAKARELESSSSSSSSVPPTSTSVDLPAVAADYASRVAARLAASAPLDRQRDRDRVKQMHREQRRKARGREEEDEGEGGGGSAPTLRTVEDAGDADDDDAAAASSRTRELQGEAQVTHTGTGSSASSSSGIKKRKSAPVALVENDEEGAEDDDAAVAAAQSKRRRSLVMTSTSTAAAPAVAKRTAAAAATASVAAATIDGEADGNADVDVPAGEPVIRDVGSSSSSGGTMKSEDDEAARSERKAAKKAKKSRVQDT